ncbi:NAD(P)H-hydrate dehydratase [Hydrogenophaga pseudoflava]|uniref:NAD(P)H-hydrate dehydratase n=1 Tax=Hydrogenophaga pseudoflava TaxID=47421 RepID=UPI0027E4EAC1|nr:NAD(P)H-hydrate dehydratase [Hydrogenophaga pseudoflava]MDQ7746549.1 NAD(P)H-hydrate dehydratase [Hydrogenophaga pseudoflava]
MTDLPKPTTMGHVRRIEAFRSEQLHDTHATGVLERCMAESLPPHELMARAGRSVAHLSLALAPHARRVWIACGPGNNGGDGLVAARHLFLRAKEHPGRPEVVITLSGDPSRLPPDAAHALAQALEAGVPLASSPPEAFDLAIDALLGIGTTRPPSGEIAAHLDHMHRSGATVLCVDVPSGLLADTGEYLGPAAALPNGARHTLSLLTLKPGLFTASGRDQAGTVWLDTLGAADANKPEPVAMLHGAADARTGRAHAAHKGSQGDVVVIGGQGLATTGAGMTGAAILAARAALHAGAGRVYVGLLADDAQAPSWDPQCPELMFRRTATLLADAALLRQAAVVCGCGGGQTVAEHLPHILSACPSLVLDADALNAIARDDALRSLLTQRLSRAWTTVVTPHPLEAARLLSTDTSSVMKDRLGAARQISEGLNVIAVLKGSGTVIHAPGRLPRINASGNPALATAGTGDVLAGWMGAALAVASGQSVAPLDAVLRAVSGHGHLADQWVKHHDNTLTAGRLAERILGTH